MFLRLRALLRTVYSNKSVPDAAAEASGKAVLPRVETVRAIMGARKHLHACIRVAVDMLSRSRA